MKKNIDDRIEQINRLFDQQHYLEKERRSADSVYRMLRYKSIKYKENVVNAQSELSATLAQRIHFRIHTLVACTIAARARKAYSFGTSYRVVTSCTSQLQRRLNILGDVGKRSNHTDTKNIIGKCAEVKAANQVLQATKKLNVTEIEFTPAIRPRTLEKIPRCQNCVIVFGQEK